MHSVNSSRHVPPIHSCLSCTYLAHHDISIIIIIVIIVVVVIIIIIIITVIITHACIHSLNNYSILHSFSTCVAPGSGL